MNITAHTEGFGATITGLDLRDAGPAMGRDLRAALLEHGLLVIRDQSLTPPEQVTATGLFGALETFPTVRGQVPGVPEIFRVASRPEDGHVEVGRYWHSDGSFRDQPTPISFWYTWCNRTRGAIRCLPTCSRRTPNSTTRSARNLPA